MAGTVLGVAALYSVIGLLAYAVTLSGREVTYIVPLSVQAEVALGLLFLGVALAVLVGAAATLAGGLVHGSLAVATFAALSSRPLLRRWRQDTDKVQARRAGRVGRDGG